MDVYLVAGVRTPFCKAGGVLETVPAEELGRLALRELVEQAELRASDLDAVVAGNVACPIEAANIGRVVALLAGLPAATPAHTVSRNCASGLEAVIDGLRRIRSGEARLVAAVGIESMSRVPLVFPDEFRSLLGKVARARGPVARLRAWAGLRPRHLRPVVALRRGLRDPVSGLGMGETAEVLAREFGISREAQDSFACRSHHKAVAARERGILAEELAPLYLPGRGGAREVVAEDVGPRPGLTLERLGRLPAVFASGGGTVTAGNSSMITDGAAAVLLACAERAKELGLRPLARLRAHAVVGLDPRRMGLGPAFVIPRLLAQAGVRLEDIDRIEINEAFAVQVLACLEALGSERFARRDLGLGAAVGTIDPDRLNVNGGAIALGHPVGASGTRLVLTLAREMGRSRVALGLAALCVGGGQGQAVLLEAVA